MLPLDKQAAMQRLVRMSMTDNGSAIDLANYSDVPTSVQVTCLAQNYRRAIVGTSYPRLYPEGPQWIGPQQLAALAKGMEIEAYLWVSFGADWRQRINDGVGHAANAQRLWLDCEGDSLLGVEGTRQRIRDSLAVLPVELGQGIYTRPGWWEPMTGSWDIHAEYPHLVLWDARYVHGDNVACQGIDVERALVSPFSPYAGFSECAMTQWHNTTVVCGLSVDLNIIHEEGNMTDQDKTDVANIVQAEIKTLVPDIVKLYLELFRQELEAAKQLPPRQ